VVEAKPNQKAATAPAAGVAKQAKPKPKPGGKPAPQPKSAAAAGAKPAGKLSRIFRYTLVVLFVGLLVAAIAYFFKTMNSPDEPRFAMEDLTPQNFEANLERERENLQERVDKGDYKEEAADQVGSEGAQPALEASAADGAQALPSPSTETADVDEDLSLLLEEKFMIHFEPNSNDIDPAALASLDRIAAFLKRHPEHKVLVNGYSDSMGPASYNVSVSRFRANAVKSYLIGKGAQPGNLIVKALGDTDPIADNATAAGRRRNRRVEISFAHSPANG
jgi:outer membrane protein OmpA-like peptidoglycan-associated protein